MNPIVPLLGFCIKLVIDNLNLRASLLNQAHNNNLIPIVDQAVGGVVGAVLMRPHTLILGPLRIVGRIVGWTFGWGIPVNANDYDYFSNIPFFHKFDMTEAVQRCALRALSPNNVPDGVNMEKVHIFVMSNKGYAIVMGSITILGCIVIGYLAYVIFQRVYTKIRRDFRIIRIKDDEKYNRQLKERAEKAKERAERAIEESRLHDINKSYGG